ncbi:MAG TPA: 5-formyltetrahydrofolate cyclo-ligase [Burkholderiales bacterium]|nr:5-formyltetrahydrofolate cyclo-ligase [Burkholderiales bacterium]
MVAAAKTAGLEPHSASTLREQKQALRRQILAARSALDPAERLRLSAAIAARLLNLPEFQRARCVLAYLSFGSELDTRDFVVNLLARGCELVLPRIDLANRRLNLYRVIDPDAQTIAGVWGIQEPDPDRCALADTAAIDAALVPGVAFTSRCERMGYGGGFYDALIRQWSTPPPLIAGAFSLQVVDTVPFGPDDRPIDALVTDTITYRRGAV